MKMNQLMTKVSLGVVLAGTLAVMTPSASYAFGEHQYYFQNEESDGTAWSYYRGYFSNESDPAVESTQPRAQTRTQRTPRRGVAEPTHTPARSCMVESNGSCR